MSWLNLNTFHNAINLVLGVVGALMVFDWTVLGMTPQQMGAVIGILAMVKLVANAVRDGLDAAIKITKPKGT
jgi:hypothetical protein